MSPSKTLLFHVISVYSTGKNKQYLYFKGSNLSRSVSHWPSLRTSLSVYASMEFSATKLFHWLYQLGLSSSSALYCIRTACSGSSRSEFQFHWFLHALIQCSGIADQWSSWRVYGGSIYQPNLLWRSSRHLFGGREWKSVFFYLVVVGRSSVVDEVERTNGRSLPLQPSAHQLFQVPLEKESNDR